MRSVVFAAVFRVAMSKTTFAVLGMACALAAGVAAQAGAVGEPGFPCKQVFRGTAQTNPNPNGRPPLVIGDSTVNLPNPNLAKLGFDVNSRGCRGIEEGINLAGKLRRKGQLPHLVLFNGYGNGGIKQKQVDQLIDTVGKRAVVLITEYNADTGKGAAPDTGALFVARKRYPHQIAVLDWVKFSRPHHIKDPLPGSWFLGDLYHPNFAGAEAYAQFVSQALPLAPEGKFPPLR